MSGFGTVRRDGDFGAVRFERVYAATQQELWDAWTSPERISRWLGATLTGPLAVGAEVRLVWGPDPDSQVELTVKELTPPERLEWQWGIDGEPPTLLRVELSPAPGGTLLVLDHSGLPISMFTGLAAGWHDFLDTLASGPPPADEHWRELLPEYKQRVAAL